MLQMIQITRKILKNFKAGKVAVTERDEKLFRYLFVNKVATVKDIMRDIFNGTSLKTVHRRLVKLSRNKLIEASAQREKGNRMIYSLTLKGFKDYIADKSEVGRVQLKSDCVEHDLTIIKIKRSFRKFKMIQAFYSENLFRSGMMDDIPEVRELRDIRPDAILKIKIKDRVLFLPLEYEASSKYSKRNEKLLAKYYTSPHVPAVIFISKNASIERRITRKESVRKTRHKGKFHYCRLENVLNAEKKLILSNVKDEVLIIS